MMPIMMHSLLQRACMFSSPAPPPASPASRPALAAPAAPASKCACHRHVPCMHSFGAVHHWPSRATARSFDRLISMASAQFHRQLAAALLLSLRAGRFGLLEHSEFRAVEFTRIEHQVNQPNPVAEWGEQNARFGVVGGRGGYTEGVVGGWVRQHTAAATNRARAHARASERWSKRPSEQQQAPACAADATLGAPAVGRLCRPPPAAASAAARALTRRQCAAAAAPALAPAAAA